MPVEKTVPKVWNVILKRREDWNVALYTGLALFAGGGGLELGLKLALGDRYKCVAYVERSIEAASVLATQMERGGLSKGVIWDDVTTFTGDVVSPFVDNIDIISAGFPCQPWSVAGNRKGTEDDRWLWPHIFRLVREIRPRSIFLENVTGLLHGGIEHVLGDLASVGFDAEWVSVRASDVGAPHRRERVFILANTRDISGQVSSPSRTDGTNGRAVAGTSGELGIASSSGRSSGSDRKREHEVHQVEVGEAAEDSKLRGVGQSRTGEGSEALGNSSSRRNQDRNTQPSRAVIEQRSSYVVNPVGKRGRGWHTGGEHAEHAFPPGPSGDWNNIDQRYWPAVKSEVRGVANGVARGLARTQQLRILGNGVVPQQAALAFQILKERN